MYSQIKLQALAQLCACVSACAHVCVCVCVSTCTKSSLSVVCFHTCLCHIKCVYVTTCLSQAPLGKCHSHCSVCVCVLSHSFAELAWGETSRCPNSSICYQTKENKKELLDGIKVLSDRTSLQHRNQYRVCN